MIIDGLKLREKAGSSPFVSKVMKRGICEDGIVRIDGKEFCTNEPFSARRAHNTENIRGASRRPLYGIDQATVTSVLGEFKGLPHRVELVRELKGVRYYNDSKATNVDATKRALENIEGNVILIAGGKDKGGSYRAIAEVTHKIKVLIVIGEAQDKITGELGSHVVIYKEEDMAGAVRAAYEVAESGDIVLLSPMCSSFDMFKDYKDRGNAFRRIVESL